MNALDWFVLVTWCVAGGVIIGTVVAIGRAVGESASRFERDR